MGLIESSFSAPSIKVQITDEIPSVDHTWYLNPSSSSSYTGLAKFCKSAIPISTPLSIYEGSNMELVLKIRNCSNLVINDALLVRYCHLSWKIAALSSPSHSIQTIGS